MSKQDRDVYKWGQGDAEAPADAGERSEESGETDVKGHVYRWGRGDAEAPADAGEVTEETEEPDVEGHINR